MDPSRWRQIEEIFESADERQGSEREALLAEACGGDEDLRREVESLLAQRSRDTALDRPVWEMAVGGRLGPYELMEPIGSGGMGTVFKARDTRLDRSVAIKISSAEFSGRFANEARAVAALNHPHVCTLHDVGPNYLVMEFVEGETLAERLSQGPLPLALVLEYGAQIADAVAAAHKHGIIHRDLKPANIMLTASGVKVLDFGLAKFEKPGEPGPIQTASHTIVGTVSYMSPEQAEGKPVDTRSDIFSLGAVLYEMVTGQRPFRRDTEMATLAAVLREDPEPLSQSAHGTRAELDRIVTRCLRKDPARRFQTAADLRAELEELKLQSETGRQGRASKLRSRRRLWLAVGTMATAALLLAAWYWRSWNAAPDGELRAEVLTSYPGVEVHPSLSPDGAKVAFSWNGEKEDNYDIYVKQIGATGPPHRLTTQSSSETLPSWSPDDRWIAFVRSDAGKRAIWAPLGKVAIMLVPPLGGPERKLTEAFGAVTMSWTPDGRWLAYSSADTETGPFSIWAISVETGERRRLTTFVTESKASQFRLGDWHPSLSPDGRTLAFARTSKTFVYELFAMRLTRDLRSDGPPARISDHRYGFVHGIAWTPNGREVVYGAGGLQSLSLWRVPISRGRVPKRLHYALPSTISPTIARTRPRLVYAWVLSTLNLWQLDLRTKERRMLIASTYQHGAPQYSPDGGRIALQSNRSGTWEIWTCDADGTNCQQLAPPGRPEFGTPRWSPDGRWLAADSRADGQPEIYVVAADGGPTRRVTEHPASDVLPSWSRDGSWIYFASDRTGRYEVWKAPKEGGPAVQVTRNGGYVAFEAPDGRHVYYTKWAMTAQPQALFRIPVEGGDETLIVPKVYGGAYGVTARGIYFQLDFRTIQFLDLVTGKVSTIAVVDKDILGGLSVSPDDKHVVWSQVDRDSRDLMLVEGFR